MRDFESFFEYSQDIMMIVDFEGHIVRMNSSFQRILGYSETLSTLDQIFIYLHPDDHENSIRVIRECMQGVSTENSYTNRYLAMDGTYRNIEWTGTTDQEHDLIFAIGRDVTEQRRSEERLAANEALYRSCLEQLIDCFALCSAVRDESGMIVDFRIEYFNEAAAQNIMDREQHLGQSFLQSFPNFKMELFGQLCKLAEEGGFLHKDVPLDGHIFDAVYYQFRDGFAVSWRDVTEQRRVAMHLQEIDKSNLISSMSASIAHEVRNPLTTVRGYLQILASKSDLQSQHDKFELMISELDRANMIISEYLSLAGNKTMNLASRNLNDIITMILPLLTTDGLKGNVEVSASLEPIPDLELDEKEMRQLLLNMCRNAIEAMEHGGELRIRTNQEGGEVVLEIIDTGPGIPSAVLEAIFEPFFTTKKEGTGLGLAVCRSIAHRHGARLDVLHTGPEGTSFVVRMPVAADRRQITGR